MVNLNMKYAYELTYANGSQVWNTQESMFSEDTMLKAFKPQGVVKVRFHRHIPNGYHLCGCGNLAKGDSDELCLECREVYGHYYEHEL